MSAQPTATANGAAATDELWAEVRRLGQEVDRLAAAVQALQPAAGPVAAPSGPPVPEHTAQAAAAFRAELDDLLAHVAAHPDERFVAYRGPRRLGFGTDDLSLWQALERDYPDGRFAVFVIDECMKYPNDTVV